MDIKGFKPGNYVTQSGYKAFIPAEVNKEWVVSDPEILALLDEATQKLSVLNSYATILPDVNVFIRMHVVKEATTSSKIEGTQTEMEAALQDKSRIVDESRDDWEEVHNYIKALNFSVKQLENLPLSCRLLKQTHSILMFGVRGTHKAPGEFRKSQNWIGGASLRDAVFVPPPHSEVNALMSDLEKFLNNTNVHVPHLVRIAIAHYQFETIHPFLDGNGRLGRLLITLYLVSSGLLEKPALYLSDFFERNRQLYYDNLTTARTKGNLAQWLKFFLVGVKETSVHGINTLNALVKLKQKIEKQKIPKLGKRKALGAKLLGHLYAKPVITVADVIDTLMISKPTANALIAEFVRLKILKEKTGFKRNRVFVFEEYLRLFGR